jgi:hypothetical protein
LALHQSSPLLLIIAVNRDCTGLAQGGQVNLTNLRLIILIALSVAPVSSHLVGQALFSSAAFLFVVLRGKEGGGRRSKGPLWGLASSHWLAGLFSPFVCFPDFFGLPFRRGGAQGEGEGLAFCELGLPIGWRCFAFSPSFYSPFSCWLSPGHWQAFASRTGKRKGKGKALLFASPLWFSCPLGALFCRRPNQKKGLTS